MIKLFLVALLLISCGRPAGEPGAEPTPDDSRPGPAATDDPFVRWLRGHPGGNQAALLAPADLLQAAAMPAAARARVDWQRQQSALMIGFELQAVPERQPCAPVVDRIAAVLAKAGYTPAAPVDGEQVAILDRPGVVRRVRYGCTDARPDPRPGCTGGDCNRPATVHLASVVEVPASPFKDVQDALAEFPPLAQGMAASSLPRFLADRLATRPMVSIGCEDWAGGSCRGDVDAWLEPPADARAWILESIDLAASRGFQTSERYKDPARDWISSTQECSGRNLFYKVERGRLWVRLAVIIGARATGTPVSCSEKTVSVTPPATGTVMVMDMPLAARTVEHIDRLTRCYVDHQANAGRGATAGAWKRLGDYLERPAIDATNRLAATFGTEHHMHDSGPADGFFLRTERPLASGGSVELYAVQERFTESFGRAVLTIKDTNGSARATVQVGQGGLDALASRDALAAAVRKAVDDSRQRSRAAAAEVQECRVLANGGQECSRRPATPQEKAAEEKRTDAFHAELAAGLKKQSAEIHAAVADMFPLARADCPLFRSGAPR